MSKIVVFGGSFNPITKAHINIINNAIKLVNANKGIIVPVGNYYTKDDLIDYYHRYEMIKLAIKSSESILINDCNNVNIQPKTLETLNHLQNLYPNDNLYFLMGKDNLLDLNNWYKPHELLSKYHIIVVDRNTSLTISDILKDDLFKNHLNNILILNSDIDNYNISSSLIRTNITKYKKYLDINVYEYIINNSLY